MTHNRIPAEARQRPACPHSRPRLRTNVGQPRRAPVRLHPCLGNKQGAAVACIDRTQNVAKRAVLQVADVERRAVVNLLMVSVVVGL
jgi:hypothetical protein